MRTDTLLHKPAKLLAVGSLLFAALVASQSAVAQTIVGSKHDLTSAGLGPIKTADADTQICVFCHTPHGASSVAPLWNKVLPGTASFTPRYASSTMDGTTGVVGPNSLTCLSCHDGVSAMDAMINQPGSGGYNSAGARPNLGAGYTWPVGVVAGAMPARTATTNVATIGQDLSDDHPIGIPYCGGFTGAACNDTDFNTGKLYKTTLGVAAVAALAPGVAGDQWWVDTSGTVIGTYTAPGTLGTRQKSDLVLYQDAAFIPTVQCASCHEPHGASAGIATFLRIPNAGSKLCLACHNK